MALTASSLATLKPLMRKLGLFNTVSEAYANTDDFVKGPCHFEDANDVVSGIETSNQGRPFSNCNSPIPITGSPPTRSSNSWSSRWNRKGSMELELVVENGGTNSGKVYRTGVGYVERDSDDYHGGDGPSWLDD
jgi:hypothetical protein